MHADQLSWALYSQSQTMIWWHCSTLPLHSLLSGALMVLLWASSQKAATKEEFAYICLYLVPFCPALTAILHTAHREIHKIEPKWDYIDNTVLLWRPPFRTRHNTASWAGVIMNSRAESVSLWIQLFSKLNMCMLQFDDALCNCRVVTVRNNLFTLHIFTFLWAA